jgi:hypothetical protein
MPTSHRLQFFENVWHGLSPWAKSNKGLCSDFSVPKSSLSLFQTIFRNFFNTYLGAYKFSNLLS